MIALIKSVAASLSTGLKEAAVPEVFELGHLTSFNAVYAGRHEIDKNLYCNLFAIPQPLRNITGEIYTCVDTINKTAGLTIEGRIGFTADSSNYIWSLQEYLRRHIHVNVGNHNAYSQAFIPWLRPIETMVHHKRIFRKSDFLLPTRREGDRGHVIQSCEPNAGIPHLRGVVDDESGGSDWYHCSRGRFGCVLFFAAPIPAAR